MGRNVELNDPSIRNELMRSCYYYITQTVLSVGVRQVRILRSNRSSRTTALLLGTDPVSTGRPASLILYWYLIVTPWSASCTCCGGSEPANH